MTENGDILNKYTISLFLENMVSSNIEILQMRPEPISLENIFKKRSRKWNCWLFGVYQQRKFASEDSFEFLCLLSVADAM